MIEKLAETTFLSKRLLDRLYGVSLREGVGYVRNSWSITDSLQWSFPTRIAPGRRSRIVRSDTSQADAGRRDRAANKGPRERVAPDFLIGAHALTQADALLTADAGFFRSYFEGLRVIAPEIA